MQSKTKIPKPACGKCETKTYILMVVIKIMRALREILLVFLYVAPFSDMFSRDFNILRDEGQNGQVWSLFAFGSVPAVRSETDGGCWGSRHSVTCLQRGPGSQSPISISVPLLPSTSDAARRESRRRKTEVPERRRYAVDEEAAPPCGFQVRL